MNCKLLEEDNLHNCDFSCDTQYGKAMFVTRHMDYSTSQRWCRNYLSELAVIPNEDVFQAIIKEAAAMADFCNCRAYRIGLLSNDLGKSFQWIDNSAAEPWYINYLHYNTLSKRQTMAIDFGAHDHTIYRLTSYSASIFQPFLCFKSNVTEEVKPVTITNTVTGNLELSLLDSIGLLTGISISFMIIILAMLCLLLVVWRERNGRNKPTADSERNSRHESIHETRNSTPYDHNPNQALVHHNTAALSESRTYCYIPELPNQSSTCNTVVHKPLITEHGGSDRLTSLFASGENSVYKGDETEPKIAFSDDDYRFTKAGSSKTRYI